MTRAAVEVFADVTCPFAHVGLRRFVTYRQARASTLPALRVRAWPLELVNGAPLETALNAQHIDELREQVAPELFGRFDRERSATSSMPALGFIAGAYAIDDATGERVSLTVRDAFFEHGLDISDPAVLDRIASSEGIGTLPVGGEATVLQDYEEGKRRGVRGSPEFYLDGRGWYCPSLHIETIDGKLEIEPDIEEVEAFLDACFA